MMLGKVLVMDEDGRVPGQTVAVTEVN